MALAQATITFDVSDYASADFDVRRTKVYATNNVPGGTVIDTVGNHIFLGSGTGTIASDGTGSISVPTPGTGSNPASWQTTIFIDYADRNKAGGREVKSFGPFTITTSANLADLVAEMPVQPEYASEVFDRLDALEAGGGSGGGSGSLTVVGSGAIDLDNTKADGYLIGYRFTGSVLVEGVAFGVGSFIFERDSAVTSGWTYRELADPSTLVAGPADVTAPTVGTLAGSAITDTTFTLTVTGASDAVGLASSPYSFSTDNGSTWTAYQSSAIYNATGKTASTGYQCRHRVKDAAGNVTTGTAITVTTTAAVLPSVTEDFNRTDGTTLNGKTTTTGGATLISPARSVSAGDNATNATTVGNKVTVPSGAANEGRNFAILTTAQNYEASIDYAITNAASGYQARIAVRAAVPDDTTGANDCVTLQVRGNGSLWWESAGVTGAQYLEGSGIPLTGTMKLKCVGTTFSAYINGTQVGASWTNSKAGGYVVAGAYNEGTSVDNFKVQYL